MITVCIHIHSGSDRPEPRFRWSFRDFKKALGRHRLKRAMAGDDDLACGSMSAFFGGRYWPTSDGGCIRLPTADAAFAFEDWVE